MQVVAFLSVKQVWGVKRKDRDGTGGGGVKDGEESRVSLSAGFNSFITMGRRPLWDSERAHTFTHMRLSV